MYTNGEREEEKVEEEYVDKKDII
jgi:hypothetical protein